MEIITGGVTAAKGFQAAATAAEIKYKGRTDMAMVYSEVPCVAAGTFTTNVVKAAPVKWDQDVVYNLVLQHRLRSATAALRSPPHRSRRIRLLQGNCRCSF